MTLLGLDLPAPEEWVPLLGMSLVVGLFEAVFFRGFVQGRLEASFGAVPAVAGAAVLYAAYHVGYGMGLSDMWFLLALGVVYAVAYRLTTNILVLWPLLTPVGAFFNNLEQRRHRAAVGLSARLRGRRGADGGGDLAGAQAPRKVRGDRGQQSHQVLEDAARLDSSSVLHQGAPSVRRTPTRPPELVHGIHAPQHGHRDQGAGPDPG